MQASVLVVCRDSLAVMKKTNTAGNMQLTWMSCENRYKVKHT